MKLKAFFFIAFGLICLGHMASAQTSDNYSQEVNDKIQEVEKSLSSKFGNELYSIEGQMQKYGLSGVSIAVINDYKVEWAKAYGVSRQADQTEVTTETLFQAASMSKTVNAMALLKIVEDYHIDLDMDVNSLLKTWQVPYNSDITTEKITLRQLLSHTAGLSTHGFGGYRKTTNLPTITETLEGKKPANSDKVKPIEAPGKSFRYSGGGTTISQLILTDVAQTSYEQFVETEIFQPLGLEHSFYSSESEKYQNQQMAHGHYQSGKTLKNKFNYYPESAAAGLWITPTDLAHILVDLQLALNGSDAKVLSQNFAQTMISPPIQDDISALGVFVERMKEETYLQHSGSNRGFRGKFMIGTDNGKGVVVMVNDPKTQILEEIIQSVARVYEWPGFEPMEAVKVEFTEDEVAAYTGKYQFKKRSVTISHKNGVFTITEKGRWSSELVPVSASTFVTKDVQPQANIDFVADESGKIVEIIATQGATVTWKKTANY